MTNDVISDGDAEDDGPADPVDRAVPVPLSARAELGREVRTRVKRLQRETTRTPPVPQAVAAMARLRHAAGRSAGTVADIWDDTIGLVPERALGRSDEPSPAEQAAHHAMIMFALHRQGRIITAHVPEVSLGKALRTLSRARRGDREDSEGVRRRFDALLTASTPDEGAYHLRGLVRLLRSEDVALDYGRLAIDLADLWTPQRTDRVRLWWARDYRKNQRMPEESSEEPTSPAESVDS